MERLWISSMEDAAIRDGFEHLRPGSDYDTLYDAAVCRAGADWLIGINATRLFFCPVRRHFECGARHVAHVGPPGAAGGGY